MFIFSAAPSVQNFGSGYASSVAEGDVIQVNGELHRIVSCSSACVAGLASGLLDSAFSSNLVGASFQYRDFTPSKLWQTVYLSGSHVWFAWNNVDGSAGGGCRGVQFYTETSADGYGLHDLHVHDNWVHDTVCDGMNFATMDPSQGTVEAYNNVIYNAGQGTSSGFNGNDPIGGEAHYACIYSPGYSVSNGPLGTGSLLIYNNTLFNCGAHSTEGGGFSFPAGVAGNLRAVLSNNIIYAAKKTEPYIDPTSDSLRFCTGAGAYCPSASLNNVLYGASASSPSYLGNSIIADPRFLNPPYDFHLAGFSFTPEGGSATLASALDLDGILRNPSAPSPGAYEYIAPANLSASTVTLAADVNPQNVGAIVTFTVQVAGSGSAIPTGSVALYDGWSLLSQTALDINGKASIPIGGLKSGSHNIRVLYTGDTVFGGSRATLTEVIGKASASVPSGALSFLSPLNISSTSQQVTLTNSGSGPLAIVDIVLAGTGTTQFSQTNNCPAPGTGGLAPGASCVIAVTFTPTQAAPSTAKAILDINLAAPATSKAVSVSGKVVAPTFSLSVPSLVFGDQASGVTSAPQNLTITNTSPLAMLTITNIVVPWPYALTSSCGSYPLNLAPNATCQVSVSYTSEGAVSNNTSLQVQVAAPGVSKSVTLKGTSVLPIAVTYATGLNFGPLTRGTKETVALTVINPAGNPAMTGLTVTFSGSPNIKRATAPGSCSTHLSGNTSCTINVTYAPLTSEVPGTVDSGTITITGTQAPVVQSVSVSLSGTAN